MLINGVDVMVCTLPTLLSLLEKETVSFSRLCHFVSQNSVILNDTVVCMSKYFVCTYVRTCSCMYMLML